jgi:hypothetical protein
MHVTPGEVKALQGIAQLHGGSLTVNPETGLPEANFLKTVLPMLAGTAVGFATMNPMLGAAVAGGLGYGITGSLEKGLMAGLGAFGGAGALGSLATAGAGLGAAGAAGAAGAGAGGAGASLGTTAAGTTIGSTAVGAGTGIGGSTIPTIAQLGTQAAGQAAPTALSGLAGSSGGLGPTLQAAQTGIMQGGAALTPAQQFAALPFGQKLSSLGTGFGNLFSDPSATFSAMGGLKGQGANLLMAGAPFLAGAMGSGSNTDIKPPEQDSLIRPQVYDPATQQYTALDPVKSSDWGTRSFQDYRTQMGYQEGGQVQQRYEQPVRTVDPAVTQYNQMLMDRAQQEYVQGMAMPGVTRPNVTPAVRPASAEGAAPDAKQKLIYDPATQQYLPNPDYAASTPASSAMDTDISPMDIYGLNIPGAVWGGGNQNAKGGQIKKYAQGGIAAIPTFQAGGDMASDAFIVPADVVSALGNGSTDAGIRLLNQYLGQAIPIEGEGDGLSDDIPATIEGEQPARVADGEVYIPPEKVAELGGGDPERGAAMLYAMMDKIREAAHGSTEQQDEVAPETVMPA